MKNKRNNDLSLFYQDLTYLNEQFQCNLLTLKFLCSLSLFKMMLLIYTVE